MTRTPLIVARFRTCCEQFVRLWHKEVLTDYYTRRATSDAVVDLAHLVRNWLHGARMMAYECTRTRGFPLSLVGALDRIQTEMDAQLRRECDFACEWLRVSREV